MLNSLTKTGVLFWILTFLILPIAHADENVRLILKLDTIEKIKSQEKRGDELYFSITEYSSLEKARHYQVPDFPTHWLSDHLDKVKDVTLWKKTLKNDEAVELIISLVERDFPPWNVDDLLGSIKLKLRWNNGELKKEWSIPNQAITHTVEEMSNSYRLNGDGAEYLLKLEVLKP